MATHDKYRLPKTILLAAALLSLVALVILIAAGIQKVNTGPAQDAWRTLWLLEFNWVAALVLLIIAVTGLFGGLWVGCQEWRERSQSGVTKQAL